MAILNNACFKNAMAASLVVALIGGPCFNLLDIPDVPGLVILDIVMVIATLMFCVELVLNWTATTAYRWSFFFTMDVIGTLSMVFEISFLLGQSEMVHAVVLRSARAAKLGARSSRVFKLVLCCSLIMRYGGTRPDAEKPQFEAKVLAQRLMSSIATRVAMLTIFLISVVPLLELPNFPREDQSMVLWARNLEEAFATQNAASFLKQASDMVEFYQNDDYAPYAIEGFGDYSLDSAATKPSRSRNDVRIEVSECVLSRSSCDSTMKAAILFNFTNAGRISAAMEITLVFIIVLVMMFMTIDLGTVLNDLLVKPLEKMLAGLKGSAQSLMNSLGTTIGMDLATAGASDEELQEEDDESRATELELIERTLQKLSRIAVQALNKNEISKEEMAKKSEYEKAVLVEMMGVKVAEEQVEQAPAQLAAWAVSLNGVKKDREVKLQTWNFDVLNMEPPELDEAIMHVFFDSEFGVAPMFCDEGVFPAFVEAVKPEYLDVPYHCFAHACDVLHTVFRLMSLAASRLWLTPAEQYALLVSALCHDMGHFGKTNPFLVETGHELAIRYNDKSPLENMHCAKLFQICQDPSQNAFGKASKELYKEARKVAVAAILHTDNANHFAMVKDLSQVYESQDASCEAQAGFGTEAEKVLCQDYRLKVLEPNKLLWLELFLHLADVSNPLKPFQLSRAWAHRVLDEFFLQGDEEKRLGLPVGMLNDRDKVNRPGSQHGFINFLVAPLVHQSVNLFPAFTALHAEMSSNLEMWCAEWTREAHPSEEEKAKKAEDIQKCKETTEKLQERLKPKTPCKPPTTDRRSFRWRGQETE